MQSNREAGSLPNHLRLAVAIAAAFALGSCGGGGNETPTSPSAVISPLPGSAESPVPESQADEALLNPTFDAQGKKKVGLCHREGNGSYHFIEVSSSAEDAHRAHGDAAPFEPVPGQPGKFFNEACEVVDVCPGCPPTRAVTAG